MPMAKKYIKKKVADHVIANKENYYRLAYSYVRNADDALDIVQESIFKALSSLQIKTDEGKVYWVEGGNSEGIPSLEFFEAIEKNQSFYITDSSKLIISFNKYDVAPGYMGTPEFEIPTEVIANILVGNEYIK